MLSLLFIVVAVSVSAQNVGIGIADFTPESSALLELRSTTSGFLMPRMNLSQIGDISAPAEGLLVYQKNGIKGFKYYDGSSWMPFGGGGSADNLGNHSATENIRLNNYWLSNNGGNKGIKITNDGKVGFGVSDPTTELDVDGDARVRGLGGGVGNRMVVADGNGNLSTQAIPVGGGAFGTGTTLALHVTADISNQDVSGVSIIHLTTNNHDIKGLTGGVAGQIICIIKRDSDKKIKFKKEEGSQKFVEDFEVKKKEGGIIMFDGIEWYVISKH